MSFIDPQMCYAPVLHEKGGFTLGIVERGMKGYHKTDYPPVETYESAENWADRLNRKLGLNDQQCAKLILQSMRR